MLCGKSAYHVTLTRIGLVRFKMLVLCLASGRPALGQPRVLGAGKRPGPEFYPVLATAGIRPQGDDHFSSSLEPWRDWRRHPAPGFMFPCTYWMDMKRDRDGHYWGNNLYPADSERAVLQRNK